MQESLRGLLVRPLVKRWLATSSSSWRQLPTPEGNPSAQAIGPNPDRLLLVGAGIAVGYGATTHDQALAGHLARQLSDLTGRGTLVDVLVTEEMTGDDLRGALNRQWLSSVDGIVATPGGIETLLLHSPRAWRRQIAELLDHVTSNGPASLHVFILGLPPLPVIVRMPRLLGHLAARSARAINAQLKLLCESRANTTFVDFAPSELAGRDGTGRTYLSWAKIIAPAVSSQLEPHPASTLSPDLLGQA